MNMQYSTFCQGYDRSTKHMYQPLYLNEEELRDKFEDLVFNVTLP